MNEFISFQKGENRKNSLAFFRIYQHENVIVSQIKNAMLKAS